MVDLNERLLGYINQNIFKKRWRLDGATLEDAFLGKGTYGRVYGVVCEEKYAATGEVQRQTAALKIIPIDATEIPNATPAKLVNERKKVEREIAIMQKVTGVTEIAYFLDSKIIERGDTEIRSWDVLILMDRLISMQEYMERSNLYSGTMPYMVEVLHLWRDISIALRRCINVSIIHADVKPANVLYSPGREAFVLSDFGEAIPAQIYAAGKPPRGTPEYIAPEMYYKEGADGRIDMYSLAVMIYELLNGNRLPLQEGRSRREAFELRIKEKKQIPPIKGIPADVNAVLLKCLEYDPQKRYATWPELQDAILEMYVAYRKSGDKPEAIAEQKRKKPALIGLAAAGALGVVVLATVLIIKPSPPFPGPTNEPATPTPTAIEETTPPPTPTPSPTPTLPPSPTPSPTVSPTPSPSSMALPDIDLEIDAVLRTETGVTVRGYISTNVEIDAQALSLWVNDTQWEITALEADGSGRCSFEAQGALDEDIGTAKIMAQLDLENGEMVHTVTVAYVSTPEPTPTVKPALQLHLNENTVFKGTGTVEISGSVSVTGEILQDSLLVSFNSNLADVVWEETEDGYTFDASLEMDLEGVEELTVRIQSRESEIEPVQESVPVVAAEPVSGGGEESYAPIEIQGLDDLSARWFGPGSTLTLAGTAEPDEALDIAINGESTRRHPVVEVDGSFVEDVDMSDYRQLLTEGENTITVSYANGQQQETLTVRYDSEAPQIEVPQTIDQFASELNVKVADQDASCRVTLVLGDTVVQEQSASEGSVTLSGIDFLGLAPGSILQIRAQDAAGNESSRDVTFRRVPIEIAVVNQSALEGTPIGKDGGTLEIATLSGAVLRIASGENVAEAVADENGNIRWDIPSGFLQGGENVISIEYAALDGVAVEGDTKRTEMSVMFDGEAPAFTIQPTELVAGEKRIDIAVSGEEAGCTVELYVNGELVPDANVTAEEGAYVLLIPESVELDASKNIELVVKDAAGNPTAQVVPFVSIAPISVANLSELQERYLGAGASVVLQLRGEAGAKLTVDIDGTAYSEVMGDLDVRQLLHSGENRISIAYSEENQFLERAIAGTSTALTVFYDPDSPQIEVAPSVITRDTTELVVRVANEPHGYSVRFVIGDQEIANLDNVEGEEVVIPDIGQYQEQMLNASGISVEVTDKANNSAVQSLTYEHTSEKKDVYMAFDGSWPDATAGETLTVEGFTVVCNDYDMSEPMYRHLYLVDESGSSLECAFTKEELSEAEYQQIVSGANVQVNENYANKAYTITGITVPASCAAGRYTMVFEIKTETEEVYSSDLGPITVETLTQSVGISDDYVDVAQNYGIGFDELMQPSFRADNIVLTGWVYHDASKLPYFDHYEILDSSGRKIVPSGAFSSLIRCKRNDIFDHANELSGATADDAGFIVALDLSNEAGIANGEQYVIQFYTSNDMEQEGGWKTVSATIQIDDSAPIVSQDSLNQLQTRWAVDLSAAQVPVNAES